MPLATGHLAIVNVLHLHSLVFFFPALHPVPLMASCSHLLGNLVEHLLTEVSAAELVLGVLLALDGDKSGAVPGIGYQRRDKHCHGVSVSTGE